MFKSGDIVWANLGSSYGWWPATVTEMKKSPKRKFEDVNCDHPEQQAAAGGPPLLSKEEKELGCDKVLSQDCGDDKHILPRKRRSCRKEAAAAAAAAAEESKENNKVDVKLHFFDDDPHEVYTITDADRLLPYGGGDQSRKLKMIRAGLKKFEVKPELGGSSAGFDYRARQAQFYKDVEMAEVMTDNSKRVANLLAQFTIEEGV